MNIALVILATTALYGGSNSTIGLGENAKPSGSDVIALGDYSTAGSYSINDTVAVGTSSIYGGRNVDGSVAIGANALANSSNIVNCVAIGASTLANTSGATNVVAIGSQLYIDGQANRFAIRTNPLTSFANSPLYWDGSTLYSNGTAINGSSVGQAKNGLYIGQETGGTAAPVWIKFFGSETGSPGMHGLYSYGSIIPLQYAFWGGTSDYPDAGINFPDITAERVGSTFATMYDVGQAITNAVGSLIEDKYNLYCTTNSGIGVVFYGNSEKPTRILWAEKVGNSSRRYYPKGYYYAPDNRYLFHFDKSLVDGATDVRVELYSDGSYVPYADGLSGDFYSSGGWRVCQYDMYDNTMMATDIYNLLVDGVADDTVREHISGTNDVAAAASNGDVDYDAVHWTFSASVIDMDLEWWTAYDDNATLRIKIIQNSNTANWMDVADGVGYTLPWNGDIVKVSVSGDTATVYWNGDDGEVWTGETNERVTYSKSGYMSARDEAERKVGGCSLKYNTTTGKIDVYVKGSKVGTLSME